MCTTLNKVRFIKSCLALLACHCLRFGQPLSAQADALDNWSTNQVVTNTYGLENVTYGNGLYVAVGEASDTTDFGFIMTSADGSNWTIRRRETDPPYTDALYAVGYAQGQYIAAGYEGAIYGSTNGVNWPLRTNLPIYNVFGVTYGFGRFVAVGDSSLTAGGSTVSNIYLSLDGTNWIRRSSGSPANDPRLIWDVAYGPSGFVAVGSGGFAYTSSSGTSWARQALAPNDLFSIGFCNGQFIVPEAPGTNLISSDGINWIATATGVSSLLGHPVYAHGVYFAGSQSGLCISHDGTNWVKSSLQFPGSVAVGDRVIVVGSTSSGMEGSSYYQLNSFVCASDPLAGLQSQVGFPPRLLLSGMTGASYRVDYLDKLSPGSNNWQILTNFSLPSSPYVLKDTHASNAPSRFYRSVLLP